MMSLTQRLLSVRLQLARELNAGEAKAIAEIRTEVDGLRQLIKAKARQSRVEPIIKEVDASAATLAMTNSTTDHILTAQKLAIGGFEKKWELSRSPSRRSR